MEKQMKYRFLRVLPVILLSVLLCSCGTSFMKKDEKIKTATVPSVVVDDSVATTTGMGSRDYQATAINDTVRAPDVESSLEEKIIYFEYDSSKIPEKFLNLVRLHASNLVSDPGISVTLEGHSDERGSREYNLALGERRAMSVRQQLVLFGVSAGQLTVVSYGEERPADDGHNDAAYGINRRVELRY
jgi:peptidoglycan-associated lipoprotein